MMACFLPKSRVLQIATLSLFLPFLIVPALQAQMPQPQRPPVREKWKSSRTSNVVAKRVRSVSRPTTHKRIVKNAVTRQPPLLQSARRWRHRHSPAC